MTSKIEELEARIVALEKSTKDDNYDRFISEFLVPLNVEYGISSSYLQQCFVQWMIRRGYSRIALANEKDLIMALEARGIQMKQNYSWGDENNKEFLPDYKEREAHRLIGFGINVTKLPKFQTFGIG